MSQLEIMLDIETLDTEQTAVILSIGAVVMDMEKLELCKSEVIRTKFYTEIDPYTQPTRTVSKATQDWWATQKNPPMNGDSHLPDVLINLSSFCMAVSTQPIIWCKGTDFDTRILAHAYKQYGIPVPWRYNDVRDCRTIFKTFQLPEPFLPNPNAHNALADAIHQAEQLLVILGNIYYE